MNIQDAHGSLQTFCAKDAGIGISVELLRKIIERQINRSTAVFSKLVSNEYLRQQDKGKYKISFSGAFDLSKSVFLFENIENPVDNSQFFPVFKVKSLTVQITCYYDAVKVAEFPISYLEITGDVKFKDEKLSLQFFKESHSRPGLKTLWTGWSQADLDHFTNSYNFTGEDFGLLLDYFKASSMFSAAPIAEAFIASVQLPDVLKVFTGIKFGNLPKISADLKGGMLMFTANSQLNFEHCPVYNPNGQTKITSKNTTNTPGSLPVIETSVDPSSPTLKYPEAANHEVDNSHSGDIFFFTPLELLKRNFDVVKPSVTASDSGGFGPIYWRYTVTAAIKSIGLSLISPWPIEFKLSIPAEVSGQAGAGVKIGCIRYEAAGAMFDGLVEPFDINFKIYLDAPSRQIVFISRVSDIKGKDFSFRTFPDLDFPINEILDFILGRASEKLITDQACKILSVTRIPITDLALLDDIVILTKNSFGGFTDGVGNVTIGVSSRM